MKKVIDHRVSTSLKEFLQYRCQADLEAFHTVTGQLFRYEDEKYDAIAYGAPEGGWVYNSDIAGVEVPSIPGYSRGVSGMSIDYINGRFLFDPAFPNIPLTGVYTASEVNWYLSTSSESKLIFETKYEQSPVLDPPDSYLPPYSTICPAAFVKPFSTNNIPHCFGGEDWSIFNHRIILMMPNEMYLAGVAKVIRDVRHSIFPLLPDWTLNQMGDLKDISWNYQDSMTTFDYYGFISNSSFQIEEADIFTAENPKLYVGIGNVEVRVFRNPRTPDNQKIPSPAFWFNNDPFVWYNGDDGFWPS